MEILLGWGTWDSISRKHLNAVVAVSDSEFVFSADHTE